MPTKVSVIPAVDARLLLMHAQALLQDPGTKATPASVYRTIEQMGFVQLDTISVVERAHHHILLTRFDSYRPQHLEHLHHKQRRLFEHMTHDASLIPVTFFPHWRVRFEKNRTGKWWTSKLDAPTTAMIPQVVERIRADGPIRSRDFETDTPAASGGWWDWRPHKTALEFLWRNGTISVSERDQFQKVYDLTERVYPEAHAQPRPTAEEHVDWACTSALERLGVATASELAAFWHSIPVAAAGAWCKQAAADRRVIPVLTVSQDGTSPKPAFAFSDWRTRVGKARRAFGAADAERVRLLSPFDPIIRDRKRALRLFGFDYRFEAFVPAAKRKYGYYVLPVLQGDRLIARLDPKLHRDRALLEVRGVWFEAGVKPTKLLRAQLDDALQRFALAIGADRVTHAPGAGAGR